MSSEPIHWLVVDTELAKNLVPKDATYEQKRDAFKRMRRGEAGMSMAVTWDSKSDEYEVYDAHTVHELADKIEEFPVVSAYNWPFDRDVIQALTGRTLVTPHVLDPLEMMFETTHERQKGTKLGQIAEWTIGETKTHGTGTDAYDLWETGRIAYLLRYNRWDVYLLRQLVRHIRDHGYLHGPAGRIEITRPPWMKDLA